MIKYYYKKIRDTKLNILPKFQIGSLVSVFDPSETELNFLTNKFNLDLDLLSDVLDPYEAPRVEDKKGIIYIFTRAPQGRMGGDPISTYPLLFIIVPDSLLLISKKELPFVAKTLRREEVYTTQKTKLFLNIFRELGNSFSDPLTSINKKINFFSFNIDKVKDKDIATFISFEVVLNEFLSALRPARQIFRSILRGQFFHLYEEDKDLLEDIKLSNDQLIERSKSSLANLVNIRQAYEVLSTNRLNRVMRLLTAITVALALPTMITSFYGMNVNLPLADNPHIFWLIIITAISALSLLFLFFYRRKLL